MWYIPISTAIGILIAVAAVFILLGGGIGYYACAVDEEHKQQKVLDRVAVTAVSKTHDKREEAFAIGMMYNHPRNQ